MDRRPLLLRPVSIPDDIEDRSLPKASGKVTLPRHIAWSFPYSYDLDNRKQLRAAYEQVMTEGLDDDVRFYIDLDTLLEVWDELWLSPHVHETQSAWLRGRGLIDQHDPKIRRTVSDDELLEALTTLSMVHRRLDQATVSTP